MRLAVSKFVWSENVFDHKPGNSTLWKKNYQCVLIKLQMTNPKEFLRLNLVDVCNQSSEWRLLDCIIWFIIWCKDSNNPVLYNGTLCLVRQLEACYNARINDRLDLHMSFTHSLYNVCLKCVWKEQPWMGLLGKVPSVGDDRVEGFWGPSSGLSEKGGLTSTGQQGSVWRQGRVHELSKCKWISVPSCCMSEWLERRMGNGAKCLALDIGRGVASRSMGEC